MSFNPYAAPQAEEVPPPPPSVPREVLQRIRNAWIAGVISGSITLIVSLMALAGARLLGFTGWELIDAALIFGLAFGIYKNSRACAVLLFLYFVGSKILIFSSTGSLSGLPLSFVLAYFYALGIAGTFEYQRLVKTRALSS